MLHLLWYDILEYIFPDCRLSSYYSLEYAGIPGATWATTVRPGYGWGCIGAEWSRSAFIAGFL